MPVTRSLVFAFALAALCPAPLSARDALPPDRTGTGGGPASTITARYTNGEGVTKPPGAALGPDAYTSPEALRRERDLTRRIEGSVCRGCD